MDASATCTENSPGGVARRNITAPKIYLWHSLVDGPSFLGLAIAVRLGNFGPRPRGAAMSRDTKGDGACRQRQFVRRRDMCIPGTQRYA